LIDNVFKYKLKIINYYMSGGTGLFKNIAMGYPADHSIPANRVLDISGNVDISGDLYVGGGYVGIGDDAPDAPLQIKGDGAISSSLRIESTNSAGGPGYMYLQRATNGDSYLLNHTNHPLRLGANDNGSQLYLKEDGNVGINNANPQVKLDVVGTIKCTGYVEAYQVYSDNWFRVRGTGDKGIYWESGTTGNAWHIYPRNRADMFMRTGSGNGGICGTISNNPQPRGYVHWTSTNEIGFLNSARAWSLRMADNKNCQVYGRLGIGTSSPSYPIHVAGGVAGLGTSTQRTYLRYFDGGGPYRTAGWGNDLVSIYGDKIIMAGTYIGVSDVRIKKDIMDLSNTLPLIEQIKPRTYKYIDPKRGDKMAYGFIAQELEEVLPCVIKTSTEKIPNIMKTADVSNGVFTLKEATDLIEDDEISIYDEDDTELKVKITEIINDKSFKVETNEELKDEYFIYGKYVDDFKAIEHNCLLSIMMKGIKELNAQNKSLEDRLAILEAKINGS
jgi:hypothetical protein